jgi:hypothetical protein
MWPLPPALRLRRRVDGDALGVSPPRVGGGREPVNPRSVNWASGKVSHRPDLRVRPGERLPGGARSAQGHAQVPTIFGGSMSQGWKPLIHNAPKLGTWQIAAVRTPLVVMKPSFTLADENAVETRPPRPTGPLIFISGRKARRPADSEKCRRFCCGLDEARRSAALNLKGEGVAKLRRPPCERESGGVDRPPPPSRGGHR